ncbi:MAG: hypothetical protein FWC00_05565 [Firmicutes bacterium]|nr:hypothetical protein [Bacillota bacterium]
MKKCIATLAIICTALLSAGAGLPSSQNEVIFGPSMARGGNFIQSFTISTYFHTREVQEHIVALTPTPTRLPNHLTGRTCGITAGANLMVAFNKVFPLIPNYSSTRLVAGRPAWSGTAPVAYQTFIQDLSIAMNETAQGVSMNQYHNGMRYIAERGGRTFNNQSMMVGSQLNLQALKAQLRQNRHASVFMTGFNIAGVNHEGHRDRFWLEQYGGNHIMAVYGYRTKIYRDAQGQIIRTKNFLRVATGFGGLGLVYLNNYLTIYDLHTAWVS